MKKSGHIIIFLKNHRGKLFRFSLLFLMWLFVFIARGNHAAGEWYATHIYPSVSQILSQIATLSHFSWEELVIVFFGIVLLRNLLSFRKRNWRKKLVRILEMLLWLGVWFYWGWGLNYFRYSFYQRMNLQPAVYNDAAFHTFLQDYTQSLNRSFAPFTTGIPTGSWEQEIKAIYLKAPQKAALGTPRTSYRPKRLAFNTLYSKVGVMGFMGPFLCEMQLNEELLPQQYPFTYAHELAHLLGVSSEAEANYWAFKVCTASNNPQIRFSGYLGILPYVIRQAYGCLPPEEYKNWLRTLNPQILSALETENRYWQERYSTWIGSIQNALYEAFLKGNQISSGQKNYGQVLSLIISEREQAPFTLTR